MNFMTEAQAHEGEMREFFEDLHRHPEPSHFEKRTNVRIREQLAALITSPQNERFAQVIVNRIWKQLMGRGFVEPVDDWEASKPTHPELLDWLAREFSWLRIHLRRRCGDEGRREERI